MSVNYKVLYFIRTWNESHVNMVLSLTNELFRMRYETSKRAIQESTVLLKGDSSSDLGPLNLSHKIMCKPFLQKVITMFPTRMLKIFVT